MSRPNAKVLLKCSHSMVVKRWPALAQLATAIEGLFVVQDWQNYGHYHAATLAAWQQKFEANWAHIKSIKSTHPFDEKFRRMFNYYFLSCKAGFETEQMHL